MKVTPRPFVLSLLAGLTLLGVGCQTANQRTSVLMTAVENGDVTSAAIEANRLAEEADERDQGGDAGRDTIWLRLEEGTTWFYAGDFQASIQAFDQAEELINDFERAAKISITDEAGAVITNLSFLPYEGTAYDKIMMNTYKAMGFMAVGEHEDALVELNRVIRRQEDATFKYDDEIRRLEKEAENDDEAYANVEQSRNDPRFAQSFDQQYAFIDGYEVYTDFVNPFSVYVDGMFSLYSFSGGRDAERARTSFVQTAQMVPNNDYIKDSLAAAESVLRGGQREPVTIVLFATGLAPKRDEIRIDLPVFLVSGDVPYVGVNFPRLTYDTSYDAFLTVETIDNSYLTAELVDMDRVVTTEFKEQLPLIVTKTIISAGTKAALSYVAIEAAGDDPWMRLAAQIATGLGQAALNQADLRTWRTLPKKVHLAVLPNPFDGQLTLRTTSGVSTPVEVDPNGINVIYAQSLNPGLPLIVHQFRLDEKVVPTVPLASQ